MAARKRAAARPAVKVPAPVLVVRGAKYMDMAGGLAWSGVLFADNLPVLKFENRADGGCLYLDWRPGMAPEFRKLIEDTLKAMPEAGDFEPVDGALGFLWDVAICGGDADRARAMRAEAEAGVLS